MTPTDRQARLSDHLAPRRRGATAVQETPRFASRLPRPPLAHPLAGGWTGANSRPAGQPSPAFGLVSPTTGNPTRVVIADDHAVVRAGLRAVLGPAKDIQVVGEAADGGEAVALAERLRPDVLVMDLSMAPMDGVAATREIVARGLPTRVMILTMEAAEGRLLPLLKCGAWGYLVKSAADRELVAAVRAVARGDIYLLPDAARALAAGLRQERRSSGAG